MKRLIAVAPFILAACQTSSGVMKRPDDTFAIARRDTGPLATLERAKESAHREASAYCSAKGQSLEIVSENLKPRSLGEFPEAEILFKCIAK